MNTKTRGSEKLMASCSGMSTLSAAELEQVAGGGLLSSPMGQLSSSYWRVFPHGIPFPEIFNTDKLQSVLKGGGLRF